MNRNYKGKNNPFYGRHHSEESKKKMYATKIGRFHTKESKKKISEGNKGKIRSKEMRERYSRVKKGISFSKEHKKNLRKNHKGMKGKHHTINAKNRMSISAKRTEEKRRDIQTKRWQNPEYREKQLKAIFAGYNLKPTKPERRLRNGLNKMFPGEYKFVGDGEIFIDGKNPDFINVNGQKKIIELFGDYWHGEEYRLITFGDNSSNKEHGQQRIKHFAKYGYKTLIVWECELKNIKKLRRKLKMFQEG